MEKNQNVGTKSAFTLIKITTQNLEQSSIANFLHNIKKNIS